MSLEQRIRRDARLLAGDEEASALLACLAENLFKPDLDATFLARKCGASRQVRGRLAAKVGPLMAYVTELRMIEALRLVRDTELKIEKIAKRLGYRVERTFRRAFKRCHGVTPNAMRRRARTEGTPDPAAAAAVALEGLEVEGDAAGRRRRGERLTTRALAACLRWSASLGLLDSEGGGELRDRLRRRHPGPPDGALAAPADDSATPPEAPAEPPLPAVLTPAEPQLEAIAAGAVFGRILGLPDADLRHAMLDGVRLGTSTAFDVLRELCYAEFRWDPERAVKVAELGVQVVEIHREIIGEAGDDWKAVAWTFLARVRMLGGDFGAADRLLDFAWEEIADGAAMAAWAEIEVRRVEGLIRMHQGRGGEAAVALDRAVELGRGLEASDPNRIHALFERLELASLMGDAEAALPLCDELEELATAGAASPDQVVLRRASACYHRGKAEAAAGRDEKALPCLLEAAGILTADPEVTAAVYELAVLGSFVLHELGRLDGRGGRLEQYDLFLRGALDRYRRLQLPVLRAAAEAELAALSAFRGEADDAYELAASAADFLERLPGHRRAWSAARRLRALVVAGAEATDVEIAETLAVLCADLDSVRWEITGAQAMPAARARRAGD